MNLFAELEGAEELERVFKRLPEECMAELEPVLTEIGQEVTSAGAAAAPVKSGELKASVETKTKRRQSGASFTFIGLLTSTHAAAVHEGVFAGGKVHEQLGSFKWWTRIFDRSSGQMVERVASALKRVLDK